MGSSGILIVAAYAVVNVREIVENPEMLEYRTRVQATLDPYGGRFLVRGGAVEVREGDWSPERLVVLEFPSIQHARDWYDSLEYREIRELRTRNSASDFVLAEGY
jgi:uncharacterized protein (DUF1330 family)